MTKTPISKVSGKKTAAQLELEAERNAIRPFEHISEPVGRVLKKTAKAMGKRS